MVLRPATQFSQERKKAAFGLTPICVSVTLLLHSILKQLVLNLSSPISYILLSVIHSPPRLHNFILYFFHFYLTFCCLLWMPFLNTQTSFLRVSPVEVIKSTCPDMMTLDCIVSLIRIYFTTYLTCLAHRKHNPEALALKLLITLVDPLSVSERRGGATESLSFPSGCLTLWHSKYIHLFFSQVTTGCGLLSCPLPLSSTECIFHMFWCKCLQHVTDEHEEPAGDRSQNLLEE